MDTDAISISSSSSSSSFDSPKSEISDDSLMKPDNKENLSKKGTDQLTALKLVSALKTSQVNTDRRHLLSDPSSDFMRSYQYPVRLREVKALNKMTFSVPEILNFLRNFQNGHKFENFNDLKV